MSFQQIPDVTEYPSFWSGPILRPKMSIVLKQDQSFDGRADKFARNIYDSTKGRIRTAVVWSDIEACLARLGNRPLRILDAGGGFGYFAQKLAAMGHQVELCDLSAEMLDLAREQIAEKGLEDRIRLIHCPIQDLKQHVTGTFDLVLCHAVLEWLAEPRQTLLGLFPFVKAGGILSLLFYNRHGLLFQSLVVGNFDYVRQGLNKKRQTALTPTNPQLPEQVYDWIGRGGPQDHRQDGGARHSRLHAPQAGSGRKVRGSAGHGAALLPSGTLCVPWALHPCDGPETSRLRRTGVNVMRDRAVGVPPTPAYITTAGE